MFLFLQKKKILCRYVRERDSQDKRAGGLMVLQKKKKRKKKMSTFPLLSNQSECTAVVTSSRCTTSGSNLQALYEKVSFLKQLL